MQGNEAALVADLKVGRFYNAYLLYGDEKFLTKAYTQKITDAALDGDSSDFNLVRLSGNPPFASLSEYAESLPVFAERKVILINDFLPEKLDDKELEAYLSLISDIPETTVIVFYLTDVKMSQKFSATKKFISAVKEHGFVCEFAQLELMKIAQLITRKVNKSKRSISPTDASYIAEITLCDMTLASEETGKLCNYVEEGGIITREIIDKLVAKRLETSIYALSDVISSKNLSKAYKLLDEYFEQRVDEITISSALSGAFIDYYRAKIAKSEGIPPQKAAEKFGFKPNRYFVMTKAYNAVSSVSIEFLRDSVATLSRLDISLKSTAINKRTLLEQTITRLMVNK